MNAALKVGMYAAAGFGLMFLLAVAVGKFIAYGNRRVPEMAERLHHPPWLTVLWRENQYEKSAFTGHLEWLDDERLLIDNGHKTVMVERCNIEAMY